MSKYEIIGGKQSSFASKTQEPVEKQVMIDTLDFISENASSDEGEPMGKETTLKCKHFDYFDKTDNIFTSFSTPEL